MSGYYVMTYGGGKYGSIAWYPTWEQAEKHRRRITDLGYWSDMPPKVEECK